MARPREEVICRRDKKCGQRGSEAGRGGSRTEQGEGPQGSAAILESQGQAQVRLRPPALPPRRRPRGGGVRWPQRYLVVS